MSSRGRLLKAGARQRGWRWPGGATSAALLLAASGVVLFRLPEILNPGVVHSDAAVVGLQAMHWLRGEWAWFLWGSGYQTSVDSWVAGLVFLPLGATPLALMLSALIGHVVAAILGFLTLRRHLPPWQSLGLVLPLILAPAPTHTFTLHPPRQASLTLVFVSIWLLDGAARGHRWRFALGAAVGALSCFADPYAMVFAPGLGLLVLLCAHDGGADRKCWLGRALWAAGGALVGAIPLLLLRLRPEADHGPLTLTKAFFFRNTELLWQECLPWLLGCRLFHQPDAAAGYEPWSPPAGLGWIFTVGAGAMVVSVILAVALARHQRLPWEVRRLGSMAALTVLVTLAAFLLSTMPMDRLATRYLVSWVLVTPFALAVSASWLGRFKLWILLGPLVVTSAVSGWIGFEPLVKGLRIVDAHLERDEARLLTELETRGIRYAVADYWAAYRLTFMFRERVIVVPTHESQDRYPPYRAAFLGTSPYAYLFDPSRSGESRQTVEQRTRHGLRERFQVGPFEVFVMERR